MDFILSCWTCQKKLNHANEDCFFWCDDTCRKNDLKYNPENCPQIETKEEETDIIADNKVEVEAPKPQETQIVGYCSHKYNCQAHKLKCIPKGLEMK